MAAKQQTKKPLAPMVAYEADREAKREALRTAMKQIERDFGEGAIMKLGENQHMAVQAVHTGSLSLDAALGIGGVPRGRIIEILGPESSGKTTVALHNLLVSQPDCGEDALSICESLVRSGAIDVVVVDSVAALVPRQEIEGNMGAATVGMQARLMSQAMRKLSAVISKSQTVVIFINQLREKVGVLYGNPETTPGGRALKFYSSVRIDVRRTEQLKRGGEVYGNHVRCKIVKNKVAPPFRVAEFDILYGQGISRMSEILDFAVKYDIVKKSGSWFSYNGERLGQGKEAVQKLIEENPSMLTELEEKVRAAMQENDGQDVQTFELDEDGDGDGDGDGDAGLLDDEFDIRTVKDDGADE